MEDWMMWVRIDDDTFIVDKRTWVEHCTYRYEFEELPQEIKEQLEVLMTCPIGLFIDNIGTRLNSTQFHIISD